MHHFIKNNWTERTTTQTLSNLVSFEGFLDKKTTTGWNKRYFVLQNNELQRYDKKDGKLLAKILLGPNTVIDAAEQCKLGFKKISNSEALTYS